MRFNALCILYCLAALSGSRTAAAADYQCRLPLDTNSTVKNGTPETKTERDDTIAFTISVSRDTTFALIDGDKFIVFKGAGFVTFYGIVNKMAKGFDIITVYDTKIDGGFYAVESREVTILGQPSASQMVGMCRPS
jgi:hypothetical protein